MKRSTWEGQTVVYKYGTPHWADLGEAGMKQLRLAHDLRNSLVEIEREHADAVAAIWADHSDVAEAQHSVDTVQAEVDDLTEKAKAERQRYRSTKPSDETASALKNARKRRRETKDTLRQVKSDAREDMKSRFQAAGRQRQVRIKALYADYVQTRGLFWASFNDVLDSHKTAAARVAEARKNGRHAEFRFHAWDGSGTIAVQLQRAADQPARTPELLASGVGPWRNVFTLAPWRDPAEGKPKGKSRHADVRFRINSDQHADSDSTHVTLPIVVGRFLPPESDVTGVRITRERVGSGHRISVSVTARIPAVEPVTKGATVAVRIEPVSEGGGAHIAQVSSDDTLPPVPDGDTADVITASGTAADIGIPESWRKIYARGQDIRSIRDGRLEEIKSQIAAALGDSDLAAAVGAGPSEVAKWRSPKRVVRIMRDWPSEHPLTKTLQSWRERDKHLWDFEANERDQIVQRRLEVYRRVAEWLCRGAAQITLDARPLQRHRPDTSSEDPYAERGARAMNAFLAPGELRRCIEIAAQRRGIEIIRVKGEK